MITGTIIEFCRFLRVNSFSVGIQETIDSLQAVHFVTLTDRQALKSALRAVLCSSREECESFERLFEQFWNPSLPPEARRQPQTRTTPRIRALEGKFSRSTSEEKVESEMESRETTGASAQERLRKMDFSKIPAADLPFLDEIALRLWKQMSLRMVRRWRSYGQEGQVDLRNTIRHSISHGGEPFETRFKRRKRKKVRLVTLLDVSGSMDLYSTFLLRFLYALHKYFKRADSFLFSTRLTHVSSALRKDHLTAVLQAVSENVEDWSGGTRIGECLRDFNRRYAKRILTPNSLMIILSDGWDTGTPEMLAEELRAIKRRVRKLIWLNPLLGLTDYKPLTRGMAAALPYADVFAPAHSLQSLLDLEKHFLKREAFTRV